MRPIRRILVAIKDPAHTPRHALEKAASLAAAFGAKVELFHAIADPVITDSLRHGKRPLSRNEAMQRIVEQRRQRLAKLAAGAAPKQTPCTLHVDWDFPAHEAIVRRAVKSRADLVILESERHLPGANLLMTHSDWELIKSCPCPLLLARSGRAYQRPTVLAAVDPLHSHDKPAALDHQLLDVAGAFSRALRGELYAVHAYLPLSYFTPTMPGEPAAASWLPPEVETAHREQLATQLRKLTARHKIPRNRQSLLHGDAPHELAAEAKRKKAQLVVMGAVSRRGLKRLFIGHTAQRALHLMPCDVLVVKPKSFKASVPRSPRTIGPIIGFTVY
jgi:universal stress protein E